MKKIFSVLSVVVLMLCALLIFEINQTVQKFSLMPQNKSTIFVNILQLQEINFDEMRWSFNYPREKLIDCNPSRDYWLVDDKGNLIFSLSNNAFRPTISENLYKKTGFTFPTLNSRNISKIVFANTHPNDQLCETDEGMLYWNNCEEIEPKFTDEEKEIFSKLILENKDAGTTMNDANFVLNPKTNRPYVWYIRLYCKEYDNIYYNCYYDAFLCRDINYNYFLQCFNKFEFSYIQIPNEINNKIKEAFDGILFEYDNV